MKEAWGNGTLSINMPSSCNHSNKEKKYPRHKKNVKSMDITYAKLVTYLTLLEGKYYGNLHRVNFTYSYVK